MEASTLLKELSAPPVVEEPLEESEGSGGDMQAACFPCLVIGVDFGTTFTSESMCLTVDYHTPLPPYQCVPCC
jgi:hypothetical protein